MLSKTWFRLLLLVATIFLLVSFHQIEAKGGRGGGSSRGGSSRGGSSRGGSSRGGSNTGSHGGKTKSYQYTKSKSKVSKAKNLLTSRKLIGGVLIGALLYHGLSSSRRMSRHPDEDELYIFIHSTKLAENFMVNNNNINTRFLLALDYDTWLNCLIVPRNISEYQCPSKFKGQVGRNTDFYVPSFYSNYTNPYQNRSKDDINLCCVTGAGSRCKTSLMLLLSAFLFNYILTNLF